MGYIRDNQDLYNSQGDMRTPEQRAKDIRKAIETDKHMPDSVREELIREAKANEKQK